MKITLLTKSRGGIHGIPRYAQELTEKLDGAHRYEYNATKSYYKNNVTYWPQPKIPGGAVIGKAITTPVRLTSVDADVYHAIDPTEIPPLRIANRCPIVGTIHDLIAFKSPMDFNRSSLILSRLYLRFLKYAADEVIAISRSTRNDAIEILDIDPDRISVINHGVDSKFRPLVGIEDDLEHPSILMVGVAQPRKNIVGVVHSLQLLQDAGLDAHLYLAGGKTDHLSEVKEYARRISVSENLHVLGRVTDNRLVQLYNIADVVAMPSFYEGFGFPLLEAMACGTPVVTSKRSSLPDVGGEVPIYVDPEKPKMIASGLKRVLSDENLSTEMSKQGRERAAMFDWSKTARRTREVYEQAIEKYQ